MLFAKAFRGAGVLIEHLAIADAQIGGALNVFSLGQAFESEIRKVQ